MKRPRRNRFVPAGGAYHSLFSSWDIVQFLQGTGVVKVRSGIVGRLETIGALGPGAAVGVNLDALAYRDREAVTSVDGYCSAPAIEKALLVYGDKDILQAVVGEVEGYGSVGVDVKGIGVAAVVLTADRVL